MAIDRKVRTYIPGKVIMTFGPIIATGFADGTFITITRSGDLFEKKKGADGSVERVHKSAFDFEVALTLLQSSLSNDLLSGVVAADEVDGSGVHPLTIKDLSGTTLFFAEQAWIQKDPDDEFGDTTGNREWMFATGPAVKFTGGNNG